MNPKRILFFTGGTALRELSRQFAKIDSNTVHLVTTFDSGGSTAILRQCFAIPALGDIRNRLLALADRNRVSEEIIEFCNNRIEKDINFDEARTRLLSLANSALPVWKNMDKEERAILGESLQYFFKRMPACFDARGASIGNLLLAGTYLEFNRDFNPVLARFNHIFHTRGIVLPIINANLHLGAFLDNGTIIVGQHLFHALKSPVRRIFLTVHESAAAIPHSLQPIECFPSALPEAISYIKSAYVICYPMGSFYSSVLSNLLPRGIGRAISESTAIKVFIPNSGLDPELGNLGIAEQARIILRRLREDAPDARNEQLMNVILLDTQKGRYPEGLDRNVERELMHLGLRIIDKNMVLENNPRMHIPEAVITAIQEISGGNLC